MEFDETFMLKDTEVHLGEVMIDTCYIVLRKIFWLHLSVTFYRDIDCCKYCFLWPHGYINPLLTHE